MSAGRVLVVGEALIDVVANSDGERRHPGGSPANVALGLARLGVPTSFITQLGDDEDGALIRAHLEASGVDMRVESVCSTSSATALIDREGNAQYVFDITWTAQPIDLPVGTDTIHTGSIAAFLEPGASSVRHLLRTWEGVVTFDPNIRPALLGSRDTVVEVFEEIVSMVDVLKMSDEDASWLYPGLDVDSVLDRTRSLGPELVAITQGSAGAILRTPSQRVKVPGIEVIAADTIGAGDTFMAALIRSVRGSTPASWTADVLSQVGGEAARAAAMTVSRPGADLPWAHELAS